MVKKGSVLENVLVEKLILGGMGLGKMIDGKKILISGGVIPESRVNVRVLKNRSNRLECQLLSVVEKSPLESTLPEHFQVYGGCRWLPIPYEKQLQIKEQQVREVFIHHPEMIQNVSWHPIIASPEIYGYRNKVEFSWGTYISARESIHDDYRFGFHESGQFDRIVNCTYCVLGDEKVNDIFHAFDRFARESDFPTYDVKRNEGFWRHLVIRRSKKTDETMVILSVNTDYINNKPEIIKQKEGLIDGLRTLGQSLQITSFYLLHNTGKADIVQGEFEILMGNPTISEKLFDLTFEISPKSFFQINTLGAEKLYEATRSLIQTKNPILFDLYAGTGTIGMILAAQSEKVYSVELVTSASGDNKKNLTKNAIQNVEVINASVEDFVVDWKGKNTKNPDVIVIDPPRAGMHPSAPAVLREFGAKEIIYVSCNPATLVRDLSLIISESNYSITDVIPVDMFPHTHHIETIVRLEK